MTKRWLLLTILNFLACALSGLAQESGSGMIDSLFRTEKEVYFSFSSPGKENLDKMTTMISIDNVVSGEVHAYANRKEFAEFLETGIEYKILPHPGDMIDPKDLGTFSRDKDGRTVWSFYPTYQEYLDFMNGFAASYPSICKLVTIGSSVQGRELIAVKISDQVDEEEGEPEFLYTSSIHGDETTGYVLMLHLIDHMLSQYGTDPQITDIINNTELYINPLANPDGTYYGGNNSVLGARRYNANGIDLNRNYPDPADGPHPDGNAWQMETEAFMELADSNDFVMGANFHGGAEVFNYPWDTWSKLTADDEWWQFVGREYVDTVYQYSPSTYFSGFDDGITNGFQWYRITGGRQDYMNYWHSCREVTLEISDVKLLPASQLLTYWNYNYRSLLNYIDQVNYGLQGIITDSVTGEPLEAKVFIFNFDKDNSYVYSKLPSGYYSRLLFEGSYSVSFICPGYFTKVIDVDIQNRERTDLDVALIPLNIGTGAAGKDIPLQVFPNPTEGPFYIMSPAQPQGSVVVTCYNNTGEKIYNKTFFDSGSPLKIDLSGNTPGLYLVRLNGNMGTYVRNVIIK